MFIFFRLLFRNVFLPKVFTVQMCDQCGIPFIQLLSVFIQDPDRRDEIILLCDPVCRAAKRRTDQTGIIDRLFRTDRLLIIAYKPVCLTIAILFGQKDLQMRHCILQAHLL